jgi:hypothetical protein
MAAAGYFGSRWKGVAPRRWFRQQSLAAGK